MSTPPQISDLLREDRAFPPPPEFVHQANFRDPEIYSRAARDPEAFWASVAGELPWMRTWDRVLDWHPPHAQWFVNGRLNISHNCLDWQIAQGRRTKAALIWEGEPGDSRTLTYQQLHREVCLFANAMKRHGIGRGDRVAIYMPMTPEAVIAMLACARIGAVHSVVFGGFSAEALSDRINDAQARAVITADGGWRRGQVIMLKNAVDEALAHCPCVRHVFVARRPHGEPFPCHMKEGRDHWWHRIVQDETPACPAEELDAEHPLFILYTSGTTGKPKGIVHTTGGYAVQTYFTMKAVFDLKPDDVFWCTADVGWITGHSYIVYGPLQAGATVVIYEGAPDTPHRGRFWEMIDRHRVSIFYTAPTAIRAFMSWGADIPDRYELSSLRLLGSVGEPINPEAWMWYHRHIGRERCPIVDTWWQTETGAHMVTGLPGITTMRPGFAGPALPGLDIAVVDQDGNEITEGSGIFVIRKPWPAMLRTLYGDDERYRATYWSRFGGRYYFTGDGAKRDTHGNFMILGRIDDVLNVSGHRIGTMEVESALVDHPTVAEAAVVGRAHEIKGQAVVAFVTLRGGKTLTPALRDDLKAHVVKKIGAIARPDDIFFTADLPKTRSGKIMRRLLRDIAEGRALGDTTTLADAGVVSRLKELYEDKEG
jgi:acetyl-CoA synthetase